VPKTLAYLEGAKWIVRTGDTAALPTRTHQAALYGMLDEETRTSWHRALAQDVDPAAGDFGQVEAAWHAAQAGEGVRAAATLLTAAARAADLSLEGSTTQLIALARRVDPSCEEAALELLAYTLARVGWGGAAAASAPPARAPAPTIPPPTTRTDPPFSELSQTEEPDSLIEHAVIVGPDSMVARAMSAAPHTAALEGRSVPPDSRAPGSQLAVRLGELAKDALLAGDNAALERWVEGLVAAGNGEGSVFTERLLAMARLGRGDIGDSLRVLRRTRSKLPPDDHRRRCQTALALGVALSVAGRPEDALLEALDALARARQIDDSGGAKACLAFLAKLYASVSRDVEAGRLRERST
jgi:hypothetical protein